MQNKNNISHLKKESREQRNNIELDSNKNIHNNTVLSKSIDSGTNEDNIIHTFKNKEEYGLLEVNNFSTDMMISNSKMVKIQTQNYNEFNERMMKDSPYTSSYASKGKRKASKENTSSKDSLRKSSQK